MAARETRVERCQPGLSTPDLKRLQPVFSVFVLNPQWNWYVILSLSLVVTRRDYIWDYEDYEKLHEFLRTFVWDYEVDYERTLGLDRVNIRRN